MGFAIVRILTIEAAPLNAVRAICCLIFEILVRGLRG